MSPKASVGEIAADALACPVCRLGLDFDAGALVCEGGHRYFEAGGFYDLWPPDQPEPELDLFSTPYGVLYDSGIKERWLARYAGWLGWGADVDRMYRLMDDGVKCEPGQVVIDVPCGGAPALRSAPGRMRGVYVGVDLSPAMLQRAVTERHDAGIESVVLARGDATRLPIPDQSVDRILCFNGLHVLPDKEAAMREFSRVLKPGGELWGDVIIANGTLLGTLSRPWTSRGWLFFHPADPLDLELTASENGFDWQQESEGAMLFFRGVIPPD